MPNSQIYSVFLLTSSTSENAKFLFKFKQDPLLRPSVGDVLTDPITLEEFKILLDQIPVKDDILIRFTDNNDRRITDEGDIRILQPSVEPIDSVTHSYFVTPANNPNRISSYSSIRFADDQTLRQLFR